MKKITILIVCLLFTVPAFAGLISTRSTAPTTCTVGDVWINPGAATNDRIYTCTATNTWTKNSGRPWVIQSTAPSDLSLIWFDDDQAPGYLVLKLHNGTTWVEHAIGEGGTFNQAGDYTLTGDWDFSGATISGIVGSVPTGTEGQILGFGAGGVVEAQTPATLAFTDNVSRNSSTGVVSVPVTATATSGSAVPFTSGGAYTALAGKENADASIVKSGEIDSQAKFEALVGWTLPSGSGSFAFDTFPAYEDSPHSSGISVNGTTLAVYSSTAGKWLTVGLTDSLDQTPITYTLTIDGTGWDGTDSVSVGGSSYTADGSKTGLSGTTSVTVTPNSGRQASCYGDGITGGVSPYSADMSANRTLSCTFSDISGVPIYSDSFTSDSSSDYTRVGSDTSRGLTVDSGAAYGSARWQWNIVTRGSVGTPDHYSQARTKITTVDSTGIVLGASAPGESSTGYIVRASNLTTVRLSTFSGNDEPITRGSWTVSTLSEDTYYTVKVIKTGSVFALYLNGTHITPDITDTTYTGGTYVGLVFDRSNGISPIPTADDFEAGL